MIFLIIFVFLLLLILPALIRQRFVFKNTAVEGEDNVTIVGILPIFRIVVNRDDIKSFTVSSYDESVKKTVTGRGFLWNPRRAYSIFKGGDVVTVWFKNEDRPLVTNYSNLESLVTREDNTGAQG